MYDFHTHSHFSSDSSSSMLAMAEGAKSIGLKGLCFTDHVDIDFANPQINFEFSYNDYLNEFESIRCLNGEDFEAFKGLELGLQPHVLNESAAFLRDRQFDFIIGSIHCVNRKDMYDGSYLDGISQKVGIENYFRDMQYCVDNFRDFDVLGHLDGIRRYLYKADDGFSYELYKGTIHSILTKLINSYKGIEVNTSGLRYGLSSFHPMPEILKLYRFLGGEILTIGSDSHSPASLGYGFDSALKLLTEIGFKYYTIFKDRKPVFIKI
jgi:histidinol-phosphatase (PHP family)